MSERRLQNDTGQVTQLLRAYENGDRTALDELMPLVYDVLLRVARSQLRRERADHTMSTRALVHESYLEFAELSEVRFNDRGHFFAAAAKTMRHILIDYAVKRQAQKRGGDWQKVPFEEPVLRTDQNVEDLLTLDQAMTRLEKVDERLVRVVECRHFTGLTIAQTAEALDISEATVSRDWARARAWLNREILRIA